MSSDKFYDIEYELEKRYLRWDSGALTNRNKILPVLMFSEVKDHTGQLFFKAEYRSELGLNSHLLSSELIDHSVPAGDIIHDIVEKMDSNDWYDSADYFYNPKEVWLHTPSGTFHLEETIGRMHECFEVIPEEGQVDYVLKSGEHISTDARFDVGIPVEGLEPGRSYDFAIRRSKKDTFTFHGNDQRKESIILTGTVKGYSVAISCLDPKHNEVLHNKLRVKKLPTGFRFKVLSDDIKKVWFKVAWIRSTDLISGETENALAQWIK